MTEVEKPMTDIEMINKLGKALAEKEKEIERLKKEKLKGLEELRKEGIEMIDGFKKINLNTIDFHDALLIHWMDYFNAKNDKTLSELRDEIKKKQSGRTYCPIWVLELIDKAIDSRRTV